MPKHKTERLPQAPSDPLPELAEYLALFDVKFSRKESQAALERYSTGLLTEHPNKNCQTMAAIVPGTSAQSLQGLLTEMVWDEADLNAQRVRVMASVPTEGDGALVFDDTGFAKQGKHSVGVDRQYSGTLGKVANCQVAVNCHYAERTIGWPVTTRLYLPTSWALNPERRAEAQIPDAIQMQTKAEIALDELDQANAWGVRHTCVTVDADYGDNPGFLNGLEARHERHVVAVRKDFRVARSRSAKIASQRADELLDSLPRREWQTIRWAEGLEGWLRAKFVAVRGWRVDGDGTRHIGWLIGQRPGRDQEGDAKYFWSDMPRSMPLERMVEYAHRRHWVEQYHEEAKEVLGWDQYQGRRWGGFHRHAALIMLTYSFLVWLEWREREKLQPPGRRRGAFSPSAG
jgi:SRSO17 transposase